MTCPTCGRTGDCRECCCQHPRHRRPLPNQTECPLCKHALEVTESNDHLTDKQRGLWSCPDCAFTFDAVHTNADGGYSCPACGEIRAEAENATLRAQVAAVWARCHEAIEADKHGTYGQGYADCARSVLATLDATSATPKSECPTWLSEHEGCQCEGVEHLSRGGDQ